jgi:hypothetical protein
VFRAMAKLERNDTFNGEAAERLTGLASEDL